MPTLLVTDFHRPVVQDRNRPTRSSTPRSACENVGNINKEKNKLSQQNLYFYLQPEQQKWGGPSSRFAVVQVV